MAKDNRFVVIHKEGSSIRSKGIHSIIVDTVTGVNYLEVNGGYGSSITPLLDANGRVVVTPKEYLGFGVDM